MPHFIIEYTANIKGEARMPALLSTVNRVLMAQGGVYPTAGIRSRAIAVEDYAIADGADDYAFVHATLKIAAGRSEDMRRKTCDEIFAAMKAHFADLFARRYLALSLELYEFGEAGTYKHNNIHARFKTVPGASKWQEGPA